MERATRERLTGAVIFVAAAVIAVPELLSRPGDHARGADPAAAAEAGPPLATYDLDINPAAAPAAVRQQERAAPAAAGRSEAIAQAVPPPVIDPPPSAASTAAATPAPIPAAATTAPPQPVAAARPPPPAAQGRWWVQLGSFSSGENAERLARDMRAKGFTIEVAKVKAGSRDLYRVRAGPEQDRDAATNLRGQLAAAGVAGTLVAP